MEKTSYSPVSTIFVAAGVASAQSAAITANGDLADYPVVVRLYATTNCHIERGTNPTATTSSMPLSAGTAEYINIKAGEKIAAIKQAGQTDGTLYITKMIRTA